MTFRRYSYVIGIIILLFLAIYFNTPAGFAILAAGILLIPVTALFLPPLRHKVKLMLEVAEVKEKRMVLRLCVENESFFPVSLLRGNLYTKNILTGEEKEFPLQLTISGHGREKCQFTIDATNCGKYQCCFRNAACYDMLSFFHIKLAEVNPVSALVLPEMFPVAVEVRPAAASEEVQEYELSEKGADLSEVFGLKEYQPGDKLHAIHWKASSKFDTLVVKEGSKSTEQSVYLIWNPGKGRTLLPEEKNALAEVYVSAACSLIEQKVPLYAGFYEENQGWQEEEVHSEEDLLAVLSRMLENADAGEAADNRLPESGRHMVIVTSEYQEDNDLFYGIKPVRTFLLLLSAKEKEQMPYQETDRIYGFHVEDKEQELWKLEI